MERCPNCGASVRVGARFCTACGHRLTNPAGGASVKPLPVVGERSSGAVPPSGGGELASAAGTDAPAMAAETATPSRWGEPVPIRPETVAIGGAEVAPASPWERPASGKSPGQDTPHLVVVAGTDGGAEGTPASDGQGEGHDATVDAAAAAPGEDTGGAPSAWSVTAADDDRVVDTAGWATSWSGDRAFGRIGESDASDARADTRNQDRAPAENAVDGADGVDPSAGLNSVERAPDVSGWRTAPAETPDHEEDLANDAGESSAPEPSVAEGSDQTTSGILVGETGGKDVEYRSAGGSPHGASVATEFEGQDPVPGDEGGAEATPVHDSQRWEGSAAPLLVSEETGTESALPASSDVREDGAGDLPGMAAVDEDGVATLRASGVDPIEPLDAPVRFGGGGTTAVERNAADGHDRPVPTRSGLERATALVAELADLLPTLVPSGEGRAAAIAAEVADDLAAVRAENDPATEDAFRSLREVLANATGRHRDIDAMLDVMGRLNVIVALQDAHDRAVAAIDRAVARLRDGNEATSD